MSATTTDSAQPVFAPAVAAALVIVGTLSILFYIVFAAYAPDLGGENDGRANALSRSAVGFSALGQFLREQDIPVLLSRGLTAKEFADASLIILTPTIGSEKSDILSVTDSEPKLIVLPKWTVAGDPLHPGWVSKAGSYDESDIVEKLLKPLAESTTFQRRSDTASVALHNGVDDTDLTSGPIESLQTIGGPEWVGYITTQDGRSVVARLMDTEIYVLADPDLLNTRGLHDAATARAAAAIIESLRSYDGPVIMDLTLHGYRRSPNILQLIFEPPLVGATLCALFAGLLLGAHAAVRFGAPEEGGRLLAFGKQALADNSAALIAMAHREHRIVPRYAAAIRRRVARAVGVPIDQHDDALNASLDRQRPTNEAGQNLPAMFAEAAAAKDEADALRVARKFYRWRGAMIHER